MWSEVSQCPPLPRVVGRPRIPADPHWTLTPLRTHSGPLGVVPVTSSWLGDHRSREGRCPGPRRGRVGAWVCVLLRRSSWVWAKRAGAWAPWWALGGTGGSTGSRGTRTSLGPGEGRPRVESQCRSPGRLPWQRAAQGLLPPAHATACLVCAEALWCPRSRTPGPRAGGGALPSPTWPECILAVGAGLLSWAAADHAGGQPPPTPGPSSELEILGSKLRPRGVGSGPETLEAWWAGRAG